MNDPHFPGNLVGKDVVYTICGNSLFLEVGTLRAIENVEHRKFLKIEKSGRIIHVNFDHVISIEEKDQ